MKWSFLWITLVLSFSGFSQTEELDSLMETWHSAAAQSDWDSYAALLSDDFVFLGTDPSERWEKEEFETFARPYFKKGNGWKFSTIFRTWYLSYDASTAWFEEELDTWMNNCRGTGVLEQDQQTGEWKLRHYSLSVLIENEKIESFIELRKN